MVQPAYRLTFEERDGYLYVHAQADSISEEIVRGYIGEIRDKVREGGHRRLMIYREIIGTLPDTVVFEISKETAQWFRGIRVALINNDEPFHDALGFSMKVATNRGGTNELFSDQESAEKWLLK